MALAESLLHIFNQILVVFIVTIISYMNLLGIGFLAFKYMSVEHQLTC